MKKVVILQPNYFPWPGFFEQVRLADTFIHLDDVQLPQGRSFITRVQVKTPCGPQWLSVPVVTANRGKQKINEAQVDDTQNWRRKHLRTLEANYSGADFFSDMYGLAEKVITRKTAELAEINIASVEKSAEFLGLETEFLRSSEFGVKSRSSQRLVDLTREIGGSVYITGHGAKNYLDHELFETAGIRVEYMDYRRKPYPQLHGSFDPHVSVLDLIVNTGAEGKKYLCSPSVYWKDFLNERD